MPDRIVRDELGKSGRWLDLKDNTDRVAFVMCIFVADDFGNFEASPGDLIRLWRDIGVNSHEQAAKVARELGDVDLIRWYEHDGKRYGHIPRWRQRLRHYKRAHPRPEPTTECKEINEMLNKKTDASLTHDGRTSDARPSSDCRREGKGSEVKRSEGKGREDGKPNQPATIHGPARPPEKRPTAFPKDFSISPAVLAWANANGRNDRLSKRLEHFRGYALANGKKYVDWDQAFMNAIRADWAQLGPPPGKPKLALS